MALLTALAALSFASACRSSEATPSTSPPAEGAPAVPVAVPPPSTATAKAKLRELPVAAAPGSGEPNLTVAPDGRILLSWVEPRGDNAHALRFSSRAPGEAWAEPRTIAEGRDWFVNWADIPAMAALPDGTLYAHWLQRSGPGKYAYDVRVTRSTDGGATWSPPVVPHRDGTSSEHGFVSFLPQDARRMGLVWLDGRRNVGEGHEGHEGHHGETGLLHTTVGRDGKLGPETVLDARACDCCQTAAVMAEGAVVVAYRDRSPTEVRDISVLRFADGAWSKPRPLAEDGWEINGCPVNGPALAASGKHVAAAWFTAPKGQDRVSVAFSEDSGATFGSPIRVDEGRPLGRVDVLMLSDGEALVVWLEQSTTGAELRVRRVRPGGNLEPSRVIADSSAARSSGFARLAAAGGDVVVAWRDTSKPPKLRTVLLEPGTPQ
ncbi:MAG: glycoside hydrolase [Myxococcaceae bacterium]|nr:glycoside hydrolase [Myxococcaceae bacterium]